MMITVVTENERMRKMSERLNNKYIPVQFIKDFGRDCAEEGIDGEEHVNEVCECIIASWLAVKDTGYAKQYLHEREEQEDKSVCKYQGQIDGCGEQFCECEAYAESISCEYQEFDYNPDGGINTVTCGMIRRGKAVNGNGLCANGERKEQGGE